MNGNIRPRRLRKFDTLRNMVRETELTKGTFIMPYLVRWGKGIKREIKSMPGQFQYSMDMLIEELRFLKDVGVNSIMLFGIPERKDELAREAYAEDGIIQKTVKEIKHSIPELVVITDVCLCEYTDHGHCGIVEKSGDFFKIDNDKTLEVLKRIAISHVKAGADMVAPSGMMDGAVGVIRGALDAAGFIDIPILAYSAKYASNFYTPFREAAESSPRFGDRSSYQMDTRNSDEALREIELDLKEGADIVMVKPALAYLDIIRRARERFLCPIAAYSVSGEYALVKAAAEKGTVSEKDIVLEILTSIKRAGADIIITYWAKEVTKWL